MIQRSASNIREDSKIFLTATDTIHWHAIKPKPAMLSCLILSHSYTL